MKNKKMIIILGLVAAGALGYYFLIYKKKDAMSESTPADPWSAEDTAAFNGAKALLEEQDPRAVGWVIEAVTKKYKTSPYKIGGKPSKTATFVELIGQFNPNKDGKYIDKFGNKGLWPQAMIDAMWDNFYNPLRASGSAL